MGVERGGLPFFPSARSERRKKKRTVRYGEVGLDAVREFRRIRWSRISGGFGYGSEDEVDCGRVKFLCREVMFNKIFFFENVLVE